MKLKELEKRYFNFEVRAASDDRGALIEGRPIVYESKTDMGDYDEVIDRGALDGTDLTDVRFLVNHDLSKIPLARSRRNNGNSTMRLSPDYEGMLIEAHVDTENNAEARALYSAVQRGDISGMSFMFSINDYEWEGLETERPVFHIKSVGSVVEVSAVSFPAYESTEIYARSKETLERAREALEKAREEQRNNSPVETEESNELELEKAKFKFRSQL